MKKILSDIQGIYSNKAWQYAAAGKRIRSNTFCFIIFLHMQTINNSRKCNS